MRMLVAALLVLSLQSPARAETLARPGSWSSFTATARDGRPVCGVRTRLPDGAELRIVADNEGDVHLIAHSPGWAIKIQGEARVSISMDRDIYVGAASVANSSTLVIESLTAGFLARFIHGTSMKADFGGVRWSVGLYGSGRAAAEMVTCATALRHSVAS